MNDLNRTKWKVSKSTCEGLFNRHSEKILTFENDRFALEILKDNGEDCDCTHSGKYSISGDLIHLTFENNDQRELKVITSLINEFRIKDLGEIAGNDEFTLVPHN